MPFKTLDEAFERLEESPERPVRYRPPGSSLSLKLGWRRRLNGDSEIRVLAVADGSIVKLFDKTAQPSNPTDVVCPHFIELKWAYGCPYDCSWCYLKGTLRFLRTHTRPVIKELDKTESHLKFFADHWFRTSELLNTGEICDSMMSENTKEPLSMVLPPLLEKSSHRLLFLTKSVDVDHFLDNGFHHNTVMSFSLNAAEVAQRWEKRAPTVEKRIAAASALYSRGYETRIRIDPMVPISRWVDSYVRLIDKVFDELRPDRITLGSLRGLQSTINNAKDKSWTRFLTDRSNWGLKVDFKKRFAMYSSILRYLDKEYDYRDTALCKETVEMWDSLELDYRSPKCNCVL